MIKITETNGKVTEVKETVNGTEKQIAYANDIKAKFMTSTISWMRDIVLNDQSAKEKAEAIINKLNNQIEAKFFIDNKDLSTRDLNKLVAKI